MSDLSEKLGEIAKLVDAATPGPWERDEDGFMGCGQVYTANADLYGGNIAAPSGDLYPRSGYSPKDDMAFIAAARTDVPFLLGLVREQAAKLARVEAIHEPIDAVMYSGRRQYMGVLKAEVVSSN